MSGSPLKKFILTPVVLSAAVFGVLTLPLALLGSKSVTIQLQQEPVFQGQLKDVSTPYLGLVAAISLGAGIANVAVTGWRLSSRKSSQVEAQLSIMAQNLKEKEELLNTLKLSEPKLEACGLKAFLDEDVTHNPEQMPSVATLTTDEIVEPLVIRNQPIEHLEHLTVEVRQVPLQAAAQRFAVAQNFLGFTHVKTAVQPSQPVDSVATKDVDELHAQLQQIMAQMASIQKALAATSLTVTSEESLPIPIQAAASHRPTPLRVIKPWSVQVL